ncbi:DUF2939 domain-containing protein [Massilia sp. MS-15]|uniref:DUF2939 domain-containing protein n=1 Tax=Massilia sp. MS-15 TaxID=2878200 RepID=UPI001CD2FC71|nr:DUF2939 domain-containing protein [Massilia sp. MS-15]MCA1246587.1 DUF2939 domain-containing protein [Massilia sp. MS-15]
MNAAGKGRGGKRLLTAVAVAALLLAATSYASPWWRLYQLQGAVAQRDAARVAAFVDFPALRASVKAQVVASMEETAQPGAARDNPFAAFGKAMALAVIDPVVDAAVSPAGVLAMLEAGELRVARHSGRNAGHDAEPAADAGRREARYALSYRSWNRVAIAREDRVGGAFILHRHGPWSWKLGGIELPRRP